MTDGHHARRSTVVALAATLCACHRTDYHVLRDSTRFLDVPAVRSCDEGEAQLARRGSWQLLYLRPPQHWFDVFPTDELWVMDLEAEVMPDIEDLVVTLDCGEGELELEHLACQAPGGPRLFVSPPADGAERGSADHSCKLDVHTEQPGHRWFLLFRPVLVRRGLRAWASPVTRSDEEAVGEDAT